MKRILVEGAGGSAGINFIKSLRLAPEKFYIVATDINKYHLELVDADKKYIVPKCTEKDYINKVNKIIEREKIEFLHPQPDSVVAVISENREKIKTKTFLPSKKTIKICHNKMVLNKVLSDASVPVPESFQIENERCINEILSYLLSKYKEKAWLRAIRGAGSRAALPVNDVETIKIWIRHWKKRMGLDYKDFMLAEYLPGKEFAFQSIWKNGELITSQARERMEYVFANLTASGQSSSPTVARTVKRDDVNKIATEAVLAVDKNATGVFCIDLKENKDGVPCVTEINPGRFFTTNNFFTEAGNNMPYYYIKMAFNETIPELPKYNSIPEGIYWIRLMDGGHKLIKEGAWSSERI